MRWRRLQVAAIAVFVVAYAVLSHYANSRAPSRDLSVALALAPVLVLAFVLLWRTLHPLIAIAGAGAALVLLHRAWPAMVHDFPEVYLAEGAGLNSLMALSFGLSLRSGRVALCTMLADKVHGPLSRAEILYTRRVTVAWTLFFAAIVMVSFGLYLFASLRTWSLFENFCVLPLMVCMFVAEYAVRRRVLPHLDHRGILAGVRTYFASSRQAPR